jgi:hypothetical protein
VPSLLVHSLASIQRANRRQLEILAWHLGRLLPVEPSPAPGPKPPPTLSCGS